ncbi:SRPBCC domain-containing protein [uncultured Psychroserpens sp.]|uniref:SRPBCC family protein n=1 Tax=uncultured Psychroserpens sp. TaxID=255436 RepID=UPI00261826FC|nr:SRPBCC domain-containing protein [uncultured Psychroserpens sp.]
MKNIKHNLQINSSPTQVFEALTTSKGLGNWWTTEVDAQPKEGYINFFGFGDLGFCKMEIKELIENKSVFWKCMDGDKEWVGTNLSFELIAEGENTILKFSHMDWREESDFFGFCNYQWGRYLESLKRLCETGKGEPFKT